MALFSLIAVPAFIIIYMKTRERFFTQVQKAREESGKLTDFYMSTIRSIKQVKTSVQRTMKKKQEKKGTR